MSLTLLETISAEPITVNQAGEYTYVLFAQLEQEAEQQIRLVVPETSVTLLVLGYGAGEGKFRAKTRVIHQAPGTKSQTIVRGVAREASRLEVSGAVTIERGAKGADGRFRSDVLLYGPQASAYTFPILEVAENEVSAAHGAAIGRVQEEQLYYLQSRGLTRQQAETLIVEGFFQPVLDLLPEGVIKTRVCERLMAKRTQTPRKEKYDKII